MLELHGAATRSRVRSALAAGRAGTIRYEGVLAAERIREAVLGVRDAGSPAGGVPLLAWLASHPNTPEDVQRDLLRSGPREVCECLCLNPRLGEGLRQALLGHPDPELRRHAEHVFARRARS